MHLAGFITKIYHDARSTEHQIITLWPYVQDYIKMGNQFARTEKSNLRPVSLAYSYKTDPKRISEIEYT